MRSSKREEILGRAIDLVEAEGLAAVTYDSLAEATGVTKSGIIYHFPSRHALLLAMHRHLAGEWERQLEELAGGPADRTSPARRLAAVVRSQAVNATRGDLLMALDAATHPDFARAWDEVDARWVPPVPCGDDADDDDAGDDDATRGYLVQLMADGLWLHDHVHGHRLTDAERDRLLRAILRFADAD